MDEYLRKRSAQIDIGPSESGHVGWVVASRAEDVGVNSAIGRLVAQHASVEFRITSDWSRIYMSDEPTAYSFDTYFCLLKDNIFQVEMGGH